MSKKPSFRRHIGEPHGEWEQALLKSGWLDIYHSYWSLLKQSGWQKSLLMIWKVLKLFVNALTARDKYSLRDRDNLTQPIQMKLSGKEKTLSEFFFKFFKSTLNFKHFPKKEDTHSWCILEIMNSEKHA